MNKVYMFYPRSYKGSEMVKEYANKNLEDYTFNDIEKLEEHRFVFVFAPLWDNARNWSGGRKDYRGRYSTLGLMIRDKNRKPFEYNIQSGAWSAKRLLEAGILQSFCFICHSAVEKSKVCKTCKEDSNVIKIAQILNGQPTLFNFDFDWRVDVTKEDKTQRLLRYIKAANIEIRNDGKLVLYKAIKNNNQSFHDSKFIYPEKGHYAEEVNINYDMEEDCGSGLHVANLRWVINNFNQNKQHKIIECIVEPKDIAVISRNTNGKIRVKRLLVGDSFEIDLVHKVSQSLDSL